MGKDLPTSTVVSPRMASESIYMVCPPAHCLTSNIVTPNFVPFSIQVEVVRSCPGMCRSCLPFRPPVRQVLPKCW